MKKKPGFKQIFDKIWTYAVLILVSAIFLFPIAWIVLASFSRSGSIYDIDGFFPKAFSNPCLFSQFTMAEIVSPLS